MIALADPLQFYESPSVSIAEHLQKCVHAKAHNNLGHIVFLFLIQSQNAIKQKMFIFLCEKTKIPFGDITKTNNFCRRFQHADLWQII